MFKFIFIHFFDLNLRFDLTSKTLNLIIKFYHTFLANFSRNVSGGASGSIPLLINFFLCRYLASSVSLGSIKSFLFYTKNPFIFLIKIYLQNLHLQLYLHLQILLMYPISKETRIYQFSFNLSLVLSIFRCFSFILFH